MKRSLILILSLMLLAFTAEAQQGAYGPSLNGGGLRYLEDEGNQMWQQDSFIDPDSPEAALDTSSGEYVGDEEVQAFEDAARAAAGPGVDLAAALEKDKQMLPDNLMYGLATGLTIGGWFALLQGKSARDNTRYLGLGIVGGIMLGVAIGTKSVYQPLIRQNMNSQALPAPKDPFFPQFNERENSNSLALFQWQTRF